MTAIGIPRATSRGMLRKIVICLAIAFLAELSFARGMPASTSDVNAATSLPYLSAHDAARLRISRVYPGGGSVLSFMLGAEGTMILKQNIVNVAIGSMDQNALMIHWRRQSATWGNNSLDCQAECPYDSGNLNQTYMAQLDQWVTLSKQDGFYIIFDEWFSPMLAQSRGEWTGFNDSSFQTHWQNFYYVFAKHFGGNTTVAGFLCCEDVVENDTWPYTSSGSSSFNQLWSAKMTNMSLAVHQADPNFNYFTEVTIDWQGGSYTMGSKAMYTNAWIPLSDPDSAHVGYRAQWMPNISIINSRTNPNYPYDGGLMNGGYNWVNQTGLPFITEFLPNAASNWVWNSTSFAWETDFLTKTYSQAIGVDFCNYDNDTITEQSPCSLFDQFGNELEWGIVYGNWAASQTLVPDYSVTATPTTQTLNAGVPGTSAITVSSMNGFAGTVNIAVATNSTSLLCTLSSTSIFGGSGTSTLSCAGSPGGNYLATVTGTSGTLSHSASVTYHVQDFKVSASPGSVSVNAGATATNTITVSPVNSFDGTVTLTVATNSTNLVCVLSSTSITSGSGSSTLSCHATPAGNYLVTVTGTSNGLTHSVNVAFRVQDFTLTASSAGPTVLVGTVGTSTINVVAVNGFAGTVNLVVMTNSTNLSCILSSTSIVGGSGISTLSCTGSVATNYLATVTGTSGTLSHAATITYHIQDFTLAANPTLVGASVGSASTSTINVAPLNAFAGTVTLAVTTNSTNLSCTLNSTSIAGSSGTSSLSCTGSVAGNYLAALTGTSGTLSHSVGVVYQVTNLPGFTLTANPATVTVDEGVASISTITVTSQNRFNGTVALAVTTNSTSLVCALSSASIAGGSGTSTLSCTGSLAGNYDATVAGINGTLSHSINVDYHVQGFTMSASPMIVTVIVGATGTSTVTVTSLNGFSGTVILAMTTNSTSLACILSVTSITGDSGTSDLSCNGSPAGNYLATVTGTDRTLVRLVTVTYSVTKALAHFAETASPTTVNALAGSPGNSTITVEPLNGFTGTVTLTASVSPSGLTCVLSPASLVLGASQTSTLSCTGPAGTYVATVAGTSSGLTANATITFTITDFTVTPSPAKVTVPPGATGNSTITVNNVNGFIGILSLTFSVSPGMGLTCTLTPDSILDGLGAAMLSCGGSAGTYNVTVTGTSGSLAHSTTVAYHQAGRFVLKVTAPSSGVLVTIDGETWTTDASQLVSLQVEDGTHTISVQSTLPFTVGGLTFPTALATSTFIGWSDGNTDNPRVVSVGEDTVLTAIYRTEVSTSSYIVAVGSLITGLGIPALIVRRRKRSKAAILPIADLHSATTD